MLYQGSIKKCYIKVIKGYIYLQQATRGASATTAPRAWAAATRKHSSTAPTSPSTSTRPPTVMINMI